MAFVLFTPDGKTLVVAEVHWSSGSAKTSLWDVCTGQRQKTIDGQRALALSPDGRTLATCAADCTVRLVDMATLEERGLLPGHAREVVAGAFSADGRMLATGGRDCLVRIWNLANLREEATLQGHLSCIRSLTFSPDGNLLVSVGDDGQLRFWDRKSNSLHIVVTAHAGRIWSAAFSPDGSMLATAASDETVKLWPVDQVVQRVSLSLHPERGASTAFLADNRTLVTGSGDRRARLWDTETGRLESFFDVDSTFVWLAGSRGGSRVAIAWHGGIIEVYELTDGTRKLAAFPQQSGVLSLAMSPDGTLLACGLGEGDHCVVRVWDVSSGDSLLNLKTDSAPLVDFSVDGKTLAIAMEGQLCRFDLDTRQLHAMRIPDLRGPRCLACALVGETLVVGSVDRSIRFYDGRTGGEQATLLGHREPVRALAFSPDGKTLVSGSESGEVILWDVLTCQELARLPGPTGVVAWFIFSPDGSRLAAAGLNREGFGEVNVWHTQRTGAGHESVSTRPRRSSQDIPFIPQQQPTAKDSGNAEGPSEADITRVHS